MLFIEGFQSVVFVTNAPSMCYQQKVGWAAFEAGPRKRSVRHLLGGLQTHSIS